MRHVLTTCPYCGCGCGVYLRVEKGKITGSMPSRNHPVSRDNLCVKGWHLHDFIHHPARLTEPMLRKNGQLVPVSWDEALDFTAKELRRIGKDTNNQGIGILSSAKCTNEENFLLQKFARAVLHTNNIDHCARLWHAPTVAGLATTFGSGAMTNSINEIEDSEVILVIGSNTTEAHPQVARRIFAAQDKGAKLIVIDPRRTRLAEFATVHLDLRPGTDIPLLNGMMRVILDESLADHLFIDMRTENFEELRDMLYRLDMDEVAAITGVGVEKISKAAQLYARAGRSVICYCLGVTQHLAGTRNVQAIANLSMLTGNVEKEFTGVDPLRGQNNVQGACDMGALPNLFPSYQAVDNQDYREKFERVWKTSLSKEPGLGLLDMTHNGPAGPMRAMFIMGENPMMSDPLLDKVEETLAGLDFLAVADLFLTETTRHAHVVFPAASFAEKTGTFTNTERRVQMVRRAIDPIGNCRIDTEIIAALAARLGYPMEYESAAEIMEEIALLSPIYGGIRHERLVSSRGLQWPCWDQNHAGTPFLHKYYFTRGKGHFIPGDHLPPAEEPCRDFPFYLNTGRIYHHYHTGTMTRKSPILSRESSEALLQINPEDAAMLKVGNGDLLTLASRRGAIAVKAEITEQVKRGSVYTSFHFHEAPINRLTIDAQDPLSKCPEFKVCAVRIEKR